MQLPAERGPVSAGLVEVLAGHQRLDVERLVSSVRALSAEGNVLTDEDFQLSLWTLYELHYHGFDGVDEAWEWNPNLLRIRRELELDFEDELRRRTEQIVDRALEAEGDVPARLFELCDSFGGPSVASFIQRRASREQLDEFLVHRSIYHLKESDPHSWVIPRITGKPKVALVELQYDEYGAGRPERLHATMFGDTLEECGLDRDYGAYLDQVPGYTLAVNNAMSLFGLHRRLFAAGMGHLGAFEATSSLPCRKYAGGLRRLGLPERAAEYFDEHVEADAVHEQLAFRDICAEVVRQDPARLRDVFFGATVCLYLDSIAGGEMLAAWEEGRTSLRVGETEAVA